MSHSYQVISSDGQVKFWYSRELKDCAERFAAEIGGRVERVPMKLHDTITCAGYELWRLANAYRIMVNPAARFIRRVDCFEDG